MDPKIDTGPNRNATELLQPGTEKVFLGGKTLQILSLKAVEYLKISLIYTQKY